jgi:hypothetical protein
MDYISETEGVQRLGRLACLVSYLNVGSVRATDAAFGDVRVSRMQTRNFRRLCRKQLTHSGPYHLYISLLLLFIRKVIYPFIYLFAFVEKLWWMNPLEGLSPRRGERA